MFYLIDILENACLACCQTTNELKIAWLKYAQHINRFNYVPERDKMDYTLLSMTDADTFISFENRYSRPLRVLDENGRIIDIRAMPEMNQGPKWPTLKSKIRYNSSSKHNVRRQRGASMYHRDCQQASNTPDTEDVPALVQIKNPRTHVTRLDAWDIYETRYNRHYTGSKSWKDQTKARKQWSKHKNKNPYTSIRYLRMDELEIEDIIEDIA